MLTLMLITLALCGCASNARQGSQVQRLRAHPQYETALMAAPEWTADALRTISNLQLEKAKLEAEK
jgi:hypothetical protein